MSATSDLPARNGRPILDGLVSVDPLTTLNPALTPVAPPRPVALEPGHAVAAAQAARDAGHAAGGFDRPSEDALAAVQVASQAFEVMRRAGRELRFETSDAGVMRIEVYDGAGRLVRTIPPNEALAIASREASWACS